MGTRQVLSQVFLERLQPCLVCDPAKIFLGIQVLIVYGFPTQPIKLKLGLQIDGTLLIVTPGPFKQSSQLEIGKIQ